MIKQLLMIFLLLSISSVAYAKSVTAIALFNDRAMLSIDGTKPKIVRAGSSYRGVELVSSNTKEAVISVNGQRETLTLNSTTRLKHSLGAKPSASYAEEVTLFVNDAGFFESDGSIDGKGIRFLVDTGASLVVLSSEQAERVGVDYLSGQMGYANTASGTAPMYSVELDEVSIGGIRINNVRAGVIVGNYPLKPLLGMTFLSRLNMNRTGNTMVLKRR
ncbi:retropepsin-like aspartic protease family protein [Arenicella xantha]|uniref:Aspartyl protease family protein n=1 Tax=Arenicella xantha TaxID=644221 RepID=A0A395JFU6_9GAMM|nr:TIGR02281 family clan AA aspartic protease [Arenicella xantha]RBP48291.1 aspartyl protease family protein [Arenicella xantha]